MSNIQNESTQKGQLVTKLRNAFGHRAEWCYFLLDEASKKGLAWEDFASAAIYRCGLTHGARVTGDDVQQKKLSVLRKKLFSGAGKKVFEMKILKADEKELSVEFHYCPLVAAWQKLGATDEQIGRLCDIAMKGDAGIAESFGAELRLGDVIAKGAKVCQVGFVKKE